MEAVPAPIPVTTPAEDTFAIKGFKLDHAPPGKLPISVTLTPLQVVIVELLPPVITKAGAQI